jgi:hypothetical protein
MRPTRRFTDPLGSRLPALERNLLRLRAVQMIMVLFYAEELKRDVLDTIQSTDSLGKVQRIPPGSKNPVDLALKVLVADAAITSAEKDEIVKLIDYRNAIGHQLHNLLADLGADKAVRWMLNHTASNPKIPKYRYDVLPRLRHFRKKIDGLYRSHHYVRSINANQLLFSLAERSFLDDIKRLDQRIQSLIQERSVATKKLQAELLLEGTGLDGMWHPAGPYSKYDNGRLTRIGVEICYRLFDAKKSPLAVAHLAQLSLAAARKRHKQWLELGGKNRTSVELTTLPKRRFYRDRD